MNAKLLMASASIALLVAANAPGAQLLIDVVSLPTNDIIHDAGRGKLYASLPSRAGVGLGNTIATIDTTSRAIDRSVFVGSEPGKLALADDASVLYTALNGAGAFRSYDTAGFTAGAQVSLGADSFTGIYFVEDIEVQPGAPGTVAISRRNAGFSPRHEGVVIYDGAVKRSVETPGHTGSNVIGFSDDPAVLYGYNNETTDFGFRKMTLDASGVQVVTSQGNLLSGFGTDFVFADGRVYVTSGRVIDPVSGTLLGTYAASGLVAPDTKAGIVYFLKGFGSTLHLALFDLETFVPLDSFEIDGVSGTPGSLMLTGDRSLAFRTSGDQLFFVSTVPVPAAAWLMLTGLSVLGMRRVRRSMPTPPRDGMLAG